MGFKEFKIECFDCHHEQSVEQPFNSTLKCAELRVEKYNELKEYQKDTVLLSIENGLVPQGDSVSDECLILLIKNGKKHIAKSVKVPIPVNVYKKLMKHKKHPLGYDITIGSLIA